MFDREVVFDAADIAPMVTYGTNPGMGMPIDGTIPSLPDEADPQARQSFDKALEYMGFVPGEKMEGKKVDYVFLAVAPTAASKTSGHSPR